MMPRSTTATHDAAPASRPRSRRCAPYRQSRRASSGFTLVELLVVIGIIALLISILLPALAAARSSAQLITCAANLRTLGQAMLLHATDRKGYFPLAGAIDVGGQEQIPDNPQYLSDTGNRYDYYANGAAQNSAAVIAGRLISAAHLSPPRSPAGSQRTTMSTHHRCGKVSYALRI
jgi:prepilin-type N-terminal cleavage/methylation domain-containing protein